MDKMLKCVTVDTLPLLFLPAIAVQMKTYTCVQFILLYKCLFFVKIMSDIPRWHLCFPPTVLIFPAITKDNKTDTPTGNLSLLFLRHSDIDLPSHLNPILPINRHILWQIANLGAVSQSEITHVCTCISHQYV